MSNNGENGVSRRTVLMTSAAAGAGMLLPAGVVDAQAAAPARTDTLVLIENGARDGRWVDHELWNPYSVGATHQTGANMICEPLAYYSAFADKMQPWLAESWEFTPDFKQLTIKTRQGVKWSDGTPFSAEDVAYTFNTLRDLGPKVKWGVDVNQSLDHATVTDPNTVVLNFKLPSPRFFFLATYKYDIGIYIVPKHIFDGQDWASFKHFDIAKGWPVTTGPWKVTGATLEQKILDRRDSWWAADQKVVPMMPMSRVVWLPNTGEQQTAQAMITGQADLAYDMLPASFPTMFRGNPKLTTFTGQKPPYGYVDWWPLSLYLNNDKPPFNDRDVRWALSYYLNREQIVDVAFLGASQVSALPMPPYPPLMPYFDAVKDLLAQYNTLDFDPKKGDARLEAKDYKKRDGKWTAPDGKPLTVQIISTGTFGAALGPIVSEMLRRHGVDAAFSLPPDFNNRFQSGDFTGSIYGHGGSIRDPYDTMRLYQGRSIAVPGAHLVNFSHWRNADYDKIVDEVYITPPDNVPRLKDLFRAAMEIWLPDLPDVQLVQNHHRIPTSTVRWGNWPSTQNAYINTAPWHLTWPMVMWHLERVQA